MEVFAITILFVIMIITYFILYSVSSLTASMKRFLELTENLLNTRGGLYPVASPFEVMTEKQSMMNAVHELNNAPLAFEEHVSELLKSGIHWLNLRAIIEEHFAKRFEVDRHEASYAQMVSVNMDVFHGRKTFVQGEETIRGVKGDYEVPGRKWWEKEKRKEEFLENVRAHFDKVTHERTTEPPGK